ncbi:lysosome membrane protein 2-like [Biomphalaria glabrata]|uniref:Lysosome membrane protein 2-like n=1 Tax=Biomphalaria glabrata TaxID=6526 RepID=A0A9W3B058_BIOGL|nr:lysosome membrane protein 2-like [Biomphalaria glabrata]XP_055892855.1 lysosome membrane protein 2-like [Biomphalaria glabrata]XP_055892856.1 lysosome membrane protein 2-like [Biomphalaria glabrata]
MCKKKVNTFVLVGILIGSGVGILFPLLASNTIVEKEIKKKMVISPSSQIYDIWQDSPVPVYMQFFMFNVENPDEVRKGEKPFLKQMGPYTYKIRKTKFGIIWNDNGTVSYRQRRTFTYIPHMSSGNEMDNVTTINPFVATIAHSIQWLPYLLPVLTYIMNTANVELFIVRPVHEVLWGYQDPTLSILKPLMPNRIPTTSIGYFIQKNATDDGLYTVYTGADNIEQMGTISRYNGDRYVKSWSTSWANMVNGSDGTLCSPLKLNRESLYVFASDICRSLKIDFKKEEPLLRGMKVRRFEVEKNAFINASANKDNIGFCIPQSQCLPSGLLNLTTCQKPVNGFTIPIIMSLPHFLSADPEVSSSVLGLQPSEQEHSIYMDIEPWTGLVLQGEKKIQINIFIQQNPVLQQTAGIRTLYFPIFWINESSVIDDEHAKILVSQLFTPMKIVNIVKYVILAISLTSFATSAAVWLVGTFISQHKKKAIVQEDDPGEPCLKTSNSRYSDFRSEMEKLGFGYERLNT